MTQTQQQTIAPEHRHLFRAVLDVCGEHFDNSKSNLDDLAEAMGWSTQHVTRGLRHLQRCGVLTCTKAQGSGMRRWRVKWNLKGAA